MRVPDPAEASVDSGRLSIAWFQNLSWDAEISNLKGALSKVDSPPLQLVLLLVAGVWAADRYLRNFS